MGKIIRSININAKLADVWPYFTDSQKIADWLMPNTFEALQGSKFTMDCPPEAGAGEVVECQVKQLKPPKNGIAQLVYTWVINNPYTETLLELELVETAGATRVNLCHSGWELGQSDHKTRHEMGWDHLLINALIPLIEV